MSFPDVNLTFPDKGYQTPRIRLTTCFLRAFKVRVEEEKRSLSVSFWEIDILFTF